MTLENTEKYVFLKVTPNPDMTSVNILLVLMASKHIGSFKF